MAMLLSAAALCAACSTTSAQTYTFSFLDPLVQRHTFAYAINNAGQVAGWGTAPGGTGNAHAVRWDGTTAFDLGTLGGPSSFGWAINDAGQVAGGSQLSPNQYAVAAVWNGSVPTALGGPDSSVYGINNSGQMVGTSAGRPTLWTGASMVDLGTPEGSIGNRAADINDAGQVVGFYTAANGYTRASVWSNGTMSTLGGFGGSLDMATAINNAGQIVGGSAIGLGSFGQSVPTRATLWSGTTPTDLGTLGGRDSFANGLNDLGQVVGQSQTANGAWHATLWNGTATTDLNTFLDASTLAAGWYLYQATGINDNGWITGNAMNGYTLEHRPFVISVTAPIPEPSTYALMLAGLAAIAFAAKRRRVPANQPTA